MSDSDLLFFLKLGFGFAAAIILFKIFSLTKMGKELIEYDPTPYADDETGSGFRKKHRKSRRKHHKK
jgi:hypothetical protein